MFNSISTDSFKGLECVAPIFRLQSITHETAPSLKLGGVSFYTNAHMNYNWSMWWKLLSYMEVQEKQKCFNIGHRPLAAQDTTSVTSDTIPVIKI